MGKPARVSSAEIYLFCSLLLSVAVGFSQARACADTQAVASDAATAITVAHHEIDADIGRKDLTAITRLCTSDFRHVYQNGSTVEMPQYVSDTRKQFQRVSTIASDTQVMSVASTPSGASDRIDQRITAIAPYRILFIHKHAHVTINYVIDEQWVHDANGGWLLQESRTISEKQDVHL